MTAHPVRTPRPAVRRALAALTGPALALGLAAGLAPGCLTAAAPAYADDLDSGHLSVNQGAECALNDLSATGGHVLRTGALPRAFNHVSAGADGVRSLCGAVRDGG